MKAARKLLIPALTAGLAITGALNFTACSDQSPFQPDNSGVASADLQLLKGSKKKVTFDGEGTVEPGVDTKIKVETPGEMRVSVKFQEDALTEPAFIRLEKMGPLSNTFRMHPADLEVPNGFSLEMAFNKDVLPGGIKKENMRIMQETENGPVELTDGFLVDDHDGWIILKATATRTDEFFLAAYVKNVLFRIEGEIDRLVVKKFPRGKKEDLDLGGGSKFIVPEGGLSEDVEIFMSSKMEVLDDGTLQKVYEFGPHGLVFDEPATIVMSIDEFGGELVDLQWFNPATGEWELSFEGALDEDGKKIILYVYHFSRYAVAH